MMDFQKPLKASRLQIIRYSLRYFGVMSKNKGEFIFIIVFVTILKNYIKSQNDYIKKRILAVLSFEKMKVMYLRMSLFNTNWAAMNFITDFIFERQLTPYGGYLATKVLNQVLFNDSKLAYTTPGSEFEYYVTEGAKALAKISRFVIFTFVSKFCHFIFGMMNVFDSDISENKRASKIFLVGLFFLGLYRYSKIQKISQYNKKSMDIAFLREKNINESLSNTQVIKSSRTEDHSIVKYQRLSKKWEEANLSFKFWVLSNDFIYQIVSATLRPGSAMLVLLLANYESKDIENNHRIINYMDMLWEIVETINKCIKLFDDLDQAIEMTHDLLYYLNMSRTKEVNKISIESFNEKIEIKDLVYSTKDKLVFSGVDFTINKGDKIALVGRNGSGKSSIFKLILGFDEFKGSITIDDIDIKRLDMPAFRSLITYVPQDTKLFDETIFYNLTFGNNKPFDEVIKECQRMQIHDIIMTFPNGYNTVVGEDGKILNGGLRQKIFYTRAFLRDTEIYMFDEPTNNLDLKHSQFLLEYLKDPKYENKTFFVICHDHSIVRKFPKILHFEEGKIKEVETI